MKQILNFIPLVIFFIFLNTHDIFTAVKALMISSSVVFVLFLILYKGVSKVEIFSFLMIMVFGALTLIFHNQAFIKWKVTLINFIFAIALIIGQYVFKKNLLQTLLGKELELEDRYWNTINLFWILFFIATGLFSLYVTYYTSDQFFGTFKTFILPGATLAISLITGIYIYKKSTQQDKSE